MQRNSTRRHCNRKEDRFRIGWKIRRYRETVELVGLFKTETRNNRYLVNPSRYVGPSHVWHDLLTAVEHLDSQVIGSVIFLRRRVKEDRVFLD